MNLFNHHFIDLAGNRLYLERYRNEPFLIVNIATESRFVPQLTRLQRVYTQLHGRGLEMLAIPCTDFDEEPRDEEEIAEFLRTEYPINFLVTSRYAVTGTQAHPLFMEILQEFGSSMLPGGTFHKYLFDRRGQLIEHWEPNILPDDPGMVHTLNQHLASPGL